MKILILIQCANLGGMEHSTLLLMEEMKEMGHQVELLSLNELGAMKPLLEERGIPASATGYQGKWGWRSFFALKRALKSKDAEALIMVGHNLMGMLALGDFCKSNRILSLHFHHQGVKSLLEWRLIYKVAIWRFDRVIYPSRFIMNEAMGLIAELNRKERIVSYPISTPIKMPELEEQARRGMCERYRLSSNPQFVGNAGWLIPRKRWDIFLQVAARVAAVLPNVRFLIAGDGPERDALEKLAAELGIADRVIWLGWQDHLEDFYQRLDVMLFNSDWDAVGRSPLEAMSYGVPVVASVIHGGLNEIITSEEYSYLIDRHDVSLLAGKIIELLQLPGLAAEVGRKARAHIEEIGSPKNHALRVLKLLKERHPSA